jgi:hypothetical protein
LLILCFCVFVVFFYRVGADELACADLGALGVQGNGDGAAIDAGGLARILQRREMVLGREEGSVLGSLRLLDAVPHTAWDPCEKFMRTTCMPVFISSTSFSTDCDTGPA